MPKAESRGWLRRGPLGSVPGGTLANPPGTGGLRWGWLRRRVGFARRASHGRAPSYAVSRFAGDRRVPKAESRGWLRRGPLGSVPGGTLADPPGDRGIAYEGVAAAAGGPRSPRGRPAPRSSTPSDPSPALSAQSPAMRGSGFTLLDLSLLGVALVRSSRVNKAAKAESSGWLRRGPLGSVPGGTLCSPCLA